MSVSLLEMGQGSVSLEFDDADVIEVRATIAGQYGAIRVIESAATYDEVEFGGERFLHYHEWTPCLISQSDKGREMLRLIATSFPARP
ncbi:MULTISPECIES: hypothetical protein [Bradyrhizobium]|jgi:hypothetical protein|uniref:hypothetical protein n=1 Tax=Bradyrhizobium TaxID=374 RepID=UPI0004815671|nr:MULTISPECIES: hypothetical protein [Bradyrhizobium]MCS3449379.1 hypothetical protein [Bradyrhizobium elkanii]MCS3559478.1 hypothetical protein [Bradyrhizobium elkanii]MCW2150676.1 hypothetical protein [Bradyrhizobium elkanii]MCW2359265.1 hypothetical protein [Bradyrhizobium elkanii]MCW2374407.1 hypothetical protein [Bradyrhizobium elkanii]